MRTRAHVPAEPVEIDVNSYADRVKVLDMLSDFCRLPDWVPDPMDGDLIQTRWQAQTGRDQLAWWSRINYCLVIWRLQALQSAGKFQHVRLTGNLQAELPLLVSAQLLRYYRAVSVFRRRSVSSGMLQKLFWLVHARTVEAALRSANALCDTLPEGEREFALGWGAIMVKVLAQTNFSTGGATISRLNLEFLPQRILCVSDLDLEVESNLPIQQREMAGMIATLYGERSLSSVFLPVLEFGAPLVELLILSEQQFKGAFMALRRQSAR